MKASQALRGLGQSLWLDSKRRGLLRSTSCLDLLLTGLTDNATIFDHASKTSNDHDDATRKRFRPAARRRAVYRIGAGRADARDGPVRGDI